jgi:hypothetical protein
MDWICSNKPENRFIGAPVRRFIGPPVDQSTGAPVFQSESKRIEVTHRCLRNCKATRFNQRVLKPM